MVINKTCQVLKLIQFTGKICTLAKIYIFKQ